MLLILEIWLTVRAFKAGWKALALLPLAVALATGIGMALKAPELVAAAPFAVIAIDVLAVCVLSVMCASGRPTPVAPTPVALPATPASVSVAL